MRDVKVWLGFAFKAIENFMGRDIQFPHEHGSKDKRSIDFETKDGQGWRITVEKL